MSNQELVDNILAHVGVKGMKWGVRKDRAVDTFVSRGLGISTEGNRKRSSAVTVSDKRKKLKTSGGHGRPAHPEAISSRTIGQVGKKSGLKALSNQDLQTYAHRLQLEQNVKRLNYNEKSAPSRFVSSLLGRQGSQLASEGVNKGTKEVGKKALKLAMAAS